MISLDFTNVLDKFRNLSSCSGEKLQENISLVENEIFALENLIDEEKYSPLAQSVKDKCEYAAAVCAFYDYVCKEGAREKIILSEKGSLVSGEDFSKKIPFVKELKKQALFAISKVLYDNEFIFAAIE